MSSAESSRRWRVGLVGSGGIAHAHAAACEQLDHVDPAIICDVSEEALQHFGRRDHDNFTVGERYLGLDKMLDEAEQEARKKLQSENADGEQVADAGLRGAIKDGAQWVSNNTTSTFFVFFWIPAFVLGDGGCHSHKSHKKFKLLGQE